MEVGGYMLVGVGKNWMTPLRMNINGVKARFISAKFGYCKFWAVSGCILAASQRAVLQIQL